MSMNIDLEQKIIFFVKIFFYKKKNLKKIGLSQVHNTTKKAYTLNQFNNLERTLIRDDISALKLK